MRIHDTIAAISSALSPSGIGIVRISGDDAITIADRIFRGSIRLAEAETHTIHYGYVYDGDDKVDQVLVMLMRGPRTFTGEDTVEFDCHGGPYVLKRVLELLLDAGAYQAEPGEFTKRAFLNGKIDLSQAEAVAEVIEANSSDALKIGMSQLTGGLSSRIKEYRSCLLNEIAFIEAALDDPEHYSLSDHRDDLQKTVFTVQNSVNRLIQYADEGMIIRSGVNTAIIGEPNAGKSSVYNLLAGCDRAIVTDIPGTTRDTITENVSIGSVRLNLTDTAGIHSSCDAVERIGIDRARKAADAADFLICVIDGSKPLTQQDQEILQFIRKKKHVILLNKSDLGSVLKIDGAISFSAKTGQGKDLLRSRVEQLFNAGALKSNDDVYVSEIRHLQALKAASKSLSLASESLQLNMPEDIVSIDLTDAYESLGTILGESVGEEIINEIFAKFCMGK